jgi:lysophospholipase L1-like esterase
MTTTTNLGLPTWDEGNTEPNLVFNQLLAASDALVQCVVQAITATPPSSPTLGLGWIVDASPTGAWVGHVNQIAVAVTGGWTFYLPENGWAAFVVSEGEDYQLVTGTWGPRGSGGGFVNPMTTVGDLIVGGTAGAPARLAAGTDDYVLTSNGPGVAPTWQPSAGGGGSGVPSVNGITGAVTIAQGTGVTVATAGSTVTISASGSTAVPSIQRGGFTDPTTTDNDLLFRKATAITGLSILFIGDSITSGQMVTTAPVGPCATDLSLGAVTVTGSNQGVPATTSANWAPGGGYYNAATAAGAAAGSRIAHIMLGTNDSGTPVSQATYRANMVALCDGLVGLGYIVVVSYPPYAPDHVTAVTSYCRAIDSLVDNFHIFLGDTQAQTYFHDNPSALQSDNIHPTQAGSDTLAGFWAQAMQAVVNGITNLNALKRLTIGSGLAINLVSGVYVLTSSGMTNPMTTAGDIIVGGASGAPGRLGIGLEGQTPVVRSGALAYEAPGLGTAVAALSITSGVVNIDLSLGDLFTLALTANVTSITFSNLPASGRARSISVRMKQDATGSRTVALPSSLKVISGSDTAVQAAANAYTLLTMTTFDQGTRWEYAMKALAA